MVRICIRILWVWLVFAFKCFNSHSNSSNLRSNDGIWLEWFEFAFECFESLRIWIRMLQIPFEWLEFAFIWNALNPFRIWIRMVKIAFESLKFGSNLYSNGSNLDSNGCRIRIWMVKIASNPPFSMLKCMHLNASNPFQVVRICVRMMEWNGSNLYSNASNLFRIECFKSLSNLHSNASNRIPNGSNG